MSLQEIETSLTDSLDTITTHWPHMLHPTVSGGIAKAPTGRVTLADDHATTDADTPRIERILSLRREIMDCLASWSRVIIEDRDIRVEIPHGTDVPGMAAFITRHAQWFAGHEAAQDATDEIRPLAARVRATVDPARKDWVGLGACPLDTDTDQGPTKCGGQVRAKQDTEGLITHATCRRCGTHDTVSWWERAIMPDASKLITAAEVPEFVRAQFGKTIKPPTVRKWIERRIIVSAGADDKGRTLYDKGAIAYALARRQIAL